jgi:RNA polymerase sigma-70 factor, ECF subfamily
MTLRVSYLDSVREYIMIDPQRLHEEAYRWEVVAALLQDHGHEVMRYCLTWLGEGLAEEVTQEVFVTAWERLPTYRLEGSLRAWLFGIAKHKCQQTYRNRARRAAIDQDSLTAIRARVQVEGPKSPEESVAQAALAVRLHESLSKLASEDRILLTLWYWKELPAAEIAEILGKTEAAIRKRLSRAQQRLKELMHEPMEASSPPKRPAQRP